MKYHFKILEADFISLKNHLYPGDLNEAVSIAICGRANNGATFLVHKIINVPHELCVRKPDFIQWPTTQLLNELPNLVKKNMAIFKIHSHPGGYSKFSELDDKSDYEFFESIYGWYDNSELHGSLVLLPNNSFFGRVVNENLTFNEIEKFSRVGREIVINYKNNFSVSNPNSINLRNIQTLGEGTLKLLSQMTIGVVGCSGTGSPVIEQLARLGAGKLILVDPDKIEYKNLNRIINATLNDADNKSYKVEVLKRAIDSMGFNTDLETINTNICEDAEAIESLSKCDILFGCMDSIDGRQILNTVSSFYLIPYIDVGVKIISDKRGGIEQICGTVHYIIPGESSLQSRGVFTAEELRSTNLLRVDQEEYNRQKKSGYIVDINVEAPAVISINMFAASLAVNEFLSHIHPIKNEKLEEFDIIRFSLTDFYLMNEQSLDPIDIYLKKYVGRGDIKPIINMPQFTNHA
ncbi:ThiF family adenylyltransferase [Fulvivirga sp. 29W222]|uniref:ThiF family adenylyltransferase n=1 Tax=Fulvivirga marina TaxID=2494733 RepID=A0A937KBM0_9BACT|nr:ThiF family adenylyltransferase [Fulvivirga marina]MBL6446402.1 ThiF family adenylyltransferase [Fulvivirga marina]